MTYSPRGRDVASAPWPTSTSIASPPRRWRSPTSAGPPASPCGRWPMPSASRRWPSTTTSRTRPRSSRLVVDRVVGDVPIPAPTGSWREDLWQFARWMREIAHSHPAVAELRRSHQVLTPKILPFTERWISVWQQSGLPLDQAIRAAATSSMVLVGLVEEELRWAQDEAPGPRRTSRTSRAPACPSNGSRTATADFELIVRARPSTGCTHACPQPSRREHRTVPDLPCPPWSSARSW